MRRQKLIASAAVLAFAAASGCGGSANNAVAPNHTVVPLASASASSPPDAVPLIGATTEQRLAPIETVLPSARVAFHLDAKKLRDAPLFTSLMSAARLFGADGAVDDVKRQCGFNPIEAIDEIVASGDSSRGVLAIRVNVPADKALACAKAVGNGGDATFHDRPAIRVRDAIAIAAGDLVLAAGDEQTLDEALARKGKGPSDAAASLVLGTGEVLAVVSTVGEKGIEHIDARLVASASELGLHARVECADEATARMIAGQKDIVADMAAGASGTPEAKELVKSISLRQDGKTLTIDMGVKGDAHAQAQYVSTLTATAMGGVRQYIAMAKTAEARSTVGAIAAALSAYAEQNGRFPPSAPPVPKDVPRAIKYQSSPSDWSAPSWQAIKFTIDDPTFYSYSFTTGKGGKETTVTAHGDLNGNGKLSTFEMKLEIGKDKHVNKGRLVVKDELE